MAELDDIQKELDHINVQIEDAKKRLTGAQLEQALKDLRAQADALQPILLQTIQSTMNMPPNSHVNIDQIVNDRKQKNKAWLDMASSALKE